MCIIAAIPAGKNVAKNTLQRCWDNNPHGGGYMFTDGTNVLTHKEMKSFRKFYQSYLNHKQQFPDSSFVVHFRISTHGKVNEDNCHPFLVNPQLGFAHNGIIRNAPISEHYSDTVMFNESILQQLPPDFLYNYAFRSLIKEYIGYGSKLAFLTASNEIHIINESAGEWADGVWWSNTGYRYERYFDYGGQRKESSPTNTAASSFKTYKQQGKAKQQSLGFASAAFPQITSDSAKFNQSKIDNRIKEIEQRLKSKTYSEEYADKLAKSYDEPCAFCAKPLSTYKEKTEGFCNKCSDKYAADWSL